MALSLCLGGGGVRGLAHLGVIEVLVERGFRISEMVGTSVGALILTYYAAVGLDLPHMRELGLGLTSRHLLAWAWLRRAPLSIQGRFRRRAGIIPDYIDLLETKTDKVLHHGVERIGMTAFDTLAREEIFYHNGRRDLSLQDAMRGSVAIPWFFPPRVCLAGNRKMRLVDGGVVNCLPVEKLFEPPFAPKQILVVDVANRSRHRDRNLRKIDRLRREHPDVPITVVHPDTIGRPTILYRTEGLEALIESGRKVASDLFG